jgi:cephalosporin-C deacetylase-like acetyl esterase
MKTFYQVDKAVMDCARYQIWNKLNNPAFTQFWHMRCQEISQVDRNVWLHVMETVIENI